MKVTDNIVTVYNKMPEEYLPDGVAMLDDIPQGGGGVDVTAEVGQTIMVEEVDSNGKPTKWKAVDYQPRTHWSEVVTDFPETQLTDTGEGAFVAEAQFSIISGEEYIVTYNGVKYSCSPFTSGSDTMLGNGSVLGFADNGLPFFAAVQSGMLMVVPLDGAASLTIKVERYNHVKIPSKYIDWDNTGVFYIDFDENKETTVTPNDVKRALALNRLICGRRNNDIYTISHIANDVDSVSLIAFCQMLSTSATIVDFNTDTSAEDPLNAPFVIT